MSDKMPQKLYARFVPNNDRLHIRKWSKEPFEGACEYVLASTQRNQTRIVYVEAETEYVSSPTPESRSRAMDELIAGDADQYDAPLSENNKKCAACGKPKYQHNGINKQCPAITVFRPEPPNQEI